MTGGSMATFDDATLEGALRSLAGSIDWPAAAPVTPSGTTAGPDIATRVRVRLTAGERPRGDHGVVAADRTLVATSPRVRDHRAARPGDRRRRRRPGAAGPALHLRRATRVRAPLAERIVRDRSQPDAPGDPGDAPEPRSPDRVGRGRDARLARPSGCRPTRGLDRRTRCGSIPARAARSPTSGQRATSCPRRPNRASASCSCASHGLADKEYYEKVIGSGTKLSIVDVDGDDGWWISGDMHFFFYERPISGYVDDGRRWVGDALVWYDGQATYRIESALGRDATIATRRIAPVAAGASGSSQQRSQPFLTIFG